MESTVRLASLNLLNIKNVKNGKIVMPHAQRKELIRNKAEVLGVYGQNGSGKTAIVDALYYLQKIMTGQSLDNEFMNYVGIENNSAEISADFYIYTEKLIYEVSYVVEFEKTEKGVEIVKEALSSAKNEGESRSYKKVFMLYQRDDSQNIFTPKVRLDDLLDFDKKIIETENNIKRDPKADTKTDLIVARKMAEKSNCSYIFGESSREIFCSKASEKFEQYAEVIRSLFKFALKDLFVIRNTHSGVISANVLLPMAFRVEQKNMGAKGDFEMPLTEPINLDTARKNLLEIIIEQINTVLYTIIPGMVVGVKNHGNQLLDSGEEGYRIELVSIRDGVQPIPIRMESEGIIKIISILNALIQAFSNPSVCLVIDELDAGIFEYLLGELLDIFNNSGKGQLIFTSHNLRALEMLDSDSIMFSTVNPNRRYIHMKNVRESNNMRDIYLRWITLGGQDEAIYQETDSLKIARAFRKAGRSIQNEREKSDNIYCRRSE